MIRFWHDKYTKRRDWAYQEYKCFCQQLHSSIPAEFEQHDQITVVLYGITQSGKTTIFLNLLGIKEEFEDIVSKTLRAGREKGKSSTPAATIYTKNASDQWSLNGETLSLDALKTRLKMLRANVENGTFKVNKESYREREIHIGIPASLFHATEFDNAGFQIIDLPGTCCENDNERKIATEIAKIYVPYADIVLIVSNANNLGSLTKNNMVDVEQLQSWYLLPAKFRILLTHTFSQNDIQVVPHPDESKIREYIKEQLKSFLKDDYPSGGDRFLYLLDCGDSWQSLKKTNEGIFKTFLPLREHFLKELRKDILASATPWGRLRMAGDIGRIAEGRKKKRLAEDQEKKKVIDAKIERVKNNKIGVENNLQFYQNRVKELKKKLKNYADYTIPEPKLPSLPESERPKESHETAEIDDYLEKAKAELKTCYSNFTQKTDEIIDEILPGFPQCVREEALFYIESESLGGRFLWWKKDTYSTYGGFAKDCKIVDEAFDHARKKLLDEIARKKENVRQRVSSSPHKRKFERRAKRYSIFLGKNVNENNAYENNVYDKKITKLKEKLADIETEEQKFVLEMDKAIKLAGDFNRSLNDACKRHIAEEKEKLKQMKNPVHQFLQLCYLTIPDKIRKEISKDE